MPPPKAPRSGGPKRRRRRRKKKRAEAVSPLTEAKQLDLDRSADDPLTPAEVVEMKSHLAFLKRFKGALRLSVNAAEDLLINGVKPPSDRGVCRHLLAKVDRTSVQKALVREPLKSDRERRAMFLAGIVRIDPQLSLLLEYLDALAHVADRREAARVFSLTVDRIDFAGASDAQIKKLLEVIRVTFEGHDRTQVLYGLLDSSSFREGLDSAMQNMPDDLAEDFKPLASTHAVVFRGEAPPADDADRTELDQGIAKLLSAPYKVLVSYPEATRSRLVELALAEQIDDKRTAETTKKLIDTLPEGDPRFVKMRIARVEQLLRSHRDEQAFALIKKLANAKVDWATRRVDALSWKRVGGVLASGKKLSDALHKGFWLEGATYVWVRTAPAEEAGRLTKEARLQSELHIPGVAGVLAHGLSDNGQVYLAIAHRGRPMDTNKPIGRLRDAMSAALEGVYLLNTLAHRGVELPDVDPGRFRWIGSNPPRAVLSSLSGARKVEPQSAAIAHIGLASKWCQMILRSKGDSDSLRDDLDAEVHRTIRRKVPLILLAKSLNEALARLF